MQWARLKPVDHKKTNSLTSVSVVVAVRDEIGHIESLLNCLLAQDYPLHMLEVIIVDDHSSDGTPEKVLSMAGQFGERLKLLHLGEYAGSPKKNALSEGIAVSSGEVILCTDGDCIMDSSWVSRMVTPFLHSNIQLVMGPVCYQTKSLFHLLQWVELSALIGVSATAAAYNNPTMGNGANLAFRRQAFFDINGYRDHAHIPSGDDEFLVKQIGQQFGVGSILFQKSVDALVTTAPCNSFSQLVNQRIRWASKWRFHSGWRDKVLPLAIFGYYLLLLISMIHLIFGNLDVLFFSFLVALKFAADVAFTYSVANFYRRPHRFDAVLLLEIIYPLYAVFFGLASIFGKYHWKGRRFS